MKPERKEQKRQDKAMKRLARECCSGSHRNKIAAKRAMSLGLSPVGALAMFKASIADYSRFGFGADHGALPVSFG